MMTGSDSPMPSEATTKIEQITGVSTEPVGTQLLWRFYSPF